MKKSIIPITIIACLVLLGCNKHHKNDESNKPNKGNAYGKNKGDLTGKEFGQERARQAHLRNEQRKLDKAKNQKKQQNRNKKKRKIQ